jgi:signal transduction histidine kinase
MTYEDCNGCFVNKGSERARKIFPERAEEALPKEPERRRGLEAGLCRTQTAYHTLIGSIDQGFYVMEVLFDRDKPVGLLLHTTNEADEEQPGSRKVPGRHPNGLLREMEPLWLDRCAEVLVTGKPVRWEDRLAATGQWFQFHAFAIGEAHGRRVGVLSRNVTEQKLAREAASRYSRVLEGINRILGTVLSCRTEEELGVVCLDVAGKLTGSKFGFIGEINDKGLQDIAVSNPGWDACQITLQEGHGKHADGLRIHGLYGCVLSDGKALFTNNPKDHADFVSLPPGHPPLQSFLGVPLVYEGRIVGIIAVANRDGGYTLQEQQQLEGLAPAVIEAFMRKRAEQALEAERTSELVKTSELLDMEVQGLNIIHDLSMKYLAGEDMKKLLQEIVEGAMIITGADKGNLQLLERSSKKLQIAAHKGFGATFFGSFDSVAAGEGICGRAMERRERVMVEDVSTCGFLSESFLTALLEEGIRAVQSTPLITRSGCVEGVISTHFKKRHVPPERELRIIDILARQAADILERERENEERLNLEEQLRQSQKMEAVGTLAGGIAHDFNNMLAVILGNAEMALDEIDAEGVRQCLESIIQASLRSRDLVKQILTFSRKNKPNGKPVRLSSLLKETYDLLRATLPTTIRMEMSFRTDSDTVLADPSLLQQVIVNMASNASHAMREHGGTFSIDVSSVTVGTRSADKEAAPGRYVKLTIADTGCGIPSELRERIFEPFFTTKQPGEGTGMGLAVVYGIVKGNGGSIDVRSRIGKGTTFTILLPFAESAPRPWCERRSFVGPGTEHIMLVDDEPAVVGTATAMLEAQGYRVSAFTEPSLALEEFSRDPSGFDLLITDETMPGMTGLKLAKKVLGIRKNFPVILCTGFSDTVSEDKARVAGIREFVMKPVTKRVMCYTIRKVLDGGK